MSCELCVEFDRWKVRLEEPEPLSEEERAALVEFLDAQHDAHVDAVGEAIWNG